MSTPNFSGNEFGNKVTDFNSPTQLPADEMQRHRWQIANADWWQSTPMRYDWRDEIPYEAGSKAYFEEIDRRFFASARQYMPCRDQPFDRLIPFDELHDKDVLEIGVGFGSHAKLIAPHTKSFTGIDLTAHAVGMTAKRMEVFEIPATIAQMDAEEMRFPNGSFDYIWSWGVIHHSADTRRVLKEMFRVMKPRGTCTVMVYHRSWWNYYVLYGLLKGILQGKLKKHGSVHHVSQVATDGALARYYTPREWRAITAGIFEIDSIRIFGLKTDIVPLPHGRLKTFVEAMVPNSLARLLTNRLRLGSFLVARMRKP